MRLAVEKAMPKGEEAISYGIAAFMLDGKKRLYPLFRRVADGEPVDAVKPQ